MKWFAENWYVLVIAIVVAVFEGYRVYLFTKKPTEEQTAKVKEWLKYAVSIAEKQLGSGTGALKLRSVYDLFVTRFPAVAKLISFETFSGWVDEALEWMNKAIDTNASIAGVIKQ